MIIYNYDDLTKRILWNIEEEAYLLQQQTGEINVTIFLSEALFARIGGYLEMFMSQDKHVTLFGYNVEKYADRSLSFYVTTAKKNKIITGETNGY